MILKQSVKVGEIWGDFTNILNLSIYVLFWQLIRLRYFHTIRGIYLLRKNTVLFCSNLHYKRVSHSSFYQIFDLRSHSCWEKPSSPLFGQLLKDCAHFDFISLIQQFISLIHDEHFKFPKIEGRFFYQVKNTTRCGHHDIRSFLFDSLKVVLRLITTNEIAHIQQLFFTFRRLKQFLKFF